MPELPEVENVCRTLSDLVPPKSKLTAVHFWRKDLRFKIPTVEIKKLAIQQDQSNELVGISRRAKFIQFEFSDQFLISHLGMTGSWKAHSEGSIEDYNPLKHDHLALKFTMSTEKSRWIIYNDPRRFGFISVVKKNQLEKYFSNYGVEPLSLSESEIDLLYAKMKSLKAPVKNFLMNQKYIVGIGNIYACEALFMARINPFRPCLKLKKVEFINLISEFQKILSNAILAGGSTISSYKNAHQKSGEFQNSHLVYNRENEICLSCRLKKINRKIQAGRSTFFCNACQV